ncbi:ubiquinol-cytochrome c reductase complex assembly factor 6 [Bombus flavifrons]|uniref:ubiquinol-cytochrome c reductase complex assembly factor 6 n=1 Tax=Bombus flavifrons TaxID=103934 RepID=UPI003704926F
MPYGISWPRFISFISLAFLTTASGSQAVHLIYRPLDDLDDLIEEAFQKRLSELQDRK